MGSAGKESACSAGDTGDMGLIPWIRNISPEEEMATHSSIRAWRIPWTEEPDGIGSSVHGVAESRTQLSN